MPARRPENYGNAAIIALIILVMIVWAALIVGSAAPSLQALLANVASFALGSVVILVVAGLTCAGSLAALGLFVGERDNGGEG